MKINLAKFSANCHFIVILSLQFVFVNLHWDKLFLNGLEFIFMLLNFQRIVETLMTQNANDGQMFSVTGIIRFRNNVHIGANCVLRNKRKPCEKNVKNSSLMNENYKEK